MTDKTTGPQKLNLRSHDIAEDKRQELLRLFPEVRTQGSEPGSSDWRGELLKDDKRWVYGVVRRIGAQ